MRDHTSLVAWQEAEGVVTLVIDLSRSHWRPPVAAIFGQVQRSSVSVMANISEGYAWLDTPSFTRHLRIAYGSALETGDLLRVLHRSGSVPEPVILPILERCGRCQRLLLGMLKRRYPAPASHP
ncbi:MAG: four helix bundle protein [Gemmatimonadales bacterium]